MTVVVLAGYESRHLPNAQPLRVNCNLVRARERVGRHGRILMVGVGGALASWVLLQLACILSLFGCFHPIIEAGRIDGTLAFRFWWLFDYMNPAHAQISHFQPEAFGLRRAASFSVLLILASAPFVGAMCCLIRLLDCYRRGEVFGQASTRTMRMFAFATIATGGSPFFLAPVAHTIGMLKPITGVTATMVGVVLLGIVLLVISHVMEVGKQLQHEEESFL